MLGIHNVRSRPLAFQAAVWDPDSDYQRGLVLGWLTTLFGADLSYEIGLQHKGLHLDVRDAHEYVAPGEVLVLDPEAQVLKVFEPGSYAAFFDHVDTIVDPGQPSLFD